MQVLNLGGNFITGSIQGATYLSQLVTIDLSNNMMSGTVNGFQSAQLVAVSAIIYMKIYTFNM